MFVQRVDLPSILRILFLAYPLVSTVAFQAFDCEAFVLADGASEEWLRADYSVRCYSTIDGVKVMDADYVLLWWSAFAAVMVYPVGIPVCYLALLLYTRRALLSEKPTKLSRALHFLHGSYKRHFFW